MTKKEGEARYQSFLRIIAGDRDITSMAVMTRLGIRYNQLKVYILRAKSEGVEVNLNRGHAAWEPMP